MCHPYQYRELKPQKPSIDTDLQIEVYLDDFHRLVIFEKTQ